MFKQPSLVAAVARGGWSSKELGQGDGLRLRSPKLLARMPWTLWTDGRDRSCSLEFLLGVCWLLSTTEVMSNTWPSSSPMLWMDGFGSKVQLLLLLQEGGAAPDGRGHP